MTKCRRQESEKSQPAFQNAKYVTKRIVVYKQKERTQEEEKVCEER